MDCVRCGGLWFEDGEDSHCIQCGNRTMPGHPYCSMGDSVTDLEHKRHRTRKVGNTFLPIHQDKPINSNRGRPTKEKKEKLLKESAQDCPIEDHPYMLFLAERWEQADEQIVALQKQQAELQSAAALFTASYQAQNTENESA
jgi:DNA-directed RNA polymerase subunit M/transcription elongation factor TFIIS